MLEPIKTLSLQVTGGTEASLPPTWAQKSIWQWHGPTDGRPARFANAKTLDVPEGVSLETLLDLLAAAIARHDALRTVLRATGGELLTQEVQGSGELSVRVFDAGEEDPWAFGEEVAGQMSEELWDGTEWPVRLAVVLVHGTPVVLVAGHYRLSMDVQSLDFLVQELMAAAAGEQQPGRWQTRDEVTFEQSAAGQAVNAEAMRYWRDALRAAPPSMFDLPAPPPDEMRYVLAEMDSAPLAWAARVLRRRWRVTGGALVLGALAAAIGCYTGHRAVVLQMFAGNRADRNRRLMLGTLISEGLLHLDLAGRSMAEIAQEAARATSAGHRHGYCDPDAVRAERAEVERLRGAVLDLAAYVNDMQTGQVALDEPAAADAAAVPEFVPGAALADPATWPGWDQAWQAKVTRKDVRFLLTVQHGAGLPLMLSCDTRYIPRQAVADLLGGMERLLFAAAVDGDVAADDLARVSAVTPVVRGPSWVRLEDGWVDLDAVRRLWREVAGPAGAVVAEPAGSGLHRLVGYLLGPPGEDPVRLHGRALAALDRRTDVRTPAWYRWVAAAPPDRDDPAAWAAQPVLAEADGRG